MPIGGSADRPAAVRAAVSGQKAQRATTGLGRPFFLAVAGFMVAVVAAGLVLALQPGTEQQRLVLSTMLATAAVATTIPTGLILVSHYRLGGRRADVDAGLIVLLAGGLWLLPTRLGPLLHAELRADLGPVLVAVALATLALSGTATVAAGSPDDIAVAYRRRVMLVLLGILPVAAFGYVLVQAGIVGLVDSAAPLSAAVLGMAAAQMLWSGFRSERWALAFIGLELFGMQFSEVVSLGNPNAGSAAWLAGDILTFAGAVIGTLGAVRVARAAAERSRRELIEATVAGVRMLQAQASTEEALHDLRSGLLAVEAFAGSMGIAAPSEQAATDARIDLLTAELARLRELVSNSSARIGRVELGNALAQLVAARPHQAIDLDVSADAVVLGRRADVLELTQNLLDNALAHAPQAHVSVRAERSLDRSAVTITVADDGPGFAPDLLAHVFDRGVTTSAAGTGLGLHIVRRTAEAMGGSVVAMNRAAGGAAVAVTLPAAPDIDLRMMESASEGGRA